MEQLMLDLLALDQNYDSDGSNLVEHLDTVGRFLYGKEQKFLTRASAEEMVFARKTKFNKIEFTVQVTAATIQQVIDGKLVRRFAFPGAREELVDEIIKKIASEPGRAQIYKDVEGDNRHSLPHVGVVFSLSEVADRLKKYGHQHNISEIKEAILILSKANLEITSEDGAYSSSESFYPRVIFGRPSSAGEEHTKTFVCFPYMTAHAAANNLLRRYSLSDSMAFGSHYARLLYKRLCVRWHNAGDGNPYTVKLTTLRDAMKNPYARIADEKRLYDAILNELKEQGHLESFSSVAITGRVFTGKRHQTKTIDYLYSLYPSKEFSKRQRISNFVRNKREQLIGPDVAKSIEGANGTA